MADVIDVRCPVGPQRLFTRLRLGTESGRYIHPENVIEMSCSDCRRTARAHGADTSHVLHRYNFGGELVETIIVDQDGNRTVAQ